MEKRDQELGIRVGRLGKLIGAGCFIALGCSLALARRPESKADKPGMTVRLHDYAGVKRDTLDRAEKETARIFREAGIDTAWVVCPLTSAELAQYPACLQPADAPRFDMNILPRFMATQLSQPDTTLGFTSLTREGVRASDASIFLDRIKEEVERTHGSLTGILGDAMAHELGHILLRTSGHSVEGIMRAKWTPEDFRLASHGQLLFTPQQAELMRSEVRERAQAQIALEPTAAGLLK